MPLKDLTVFLTAVIFEYYVCIKSLGNVSLDSVNVKRKKKQRKTPRDHPLQFSKYNVRQDIIMSI